MTDKLSDRVAMGRVKGRERDLRDGSDPVRFGAAISRCEGYPPACIDLERCMRDGECFANPPHICAARQIEELLSSIGDRAGMDKAYLRKVASMLRSGLVSI